MIIYLTSMVSGDHIVTEVHVGTGPHDLRLAGALSLDLSEWQLFGSALMMGADELGHGFLRVTTSDDRAVVEHFHRKDNPPNDPPDRSPDHRLGH